MKRYYLIVFALLGFLTFSACEDELDIDPTNGVEFDEAITDEVSLNRAALGAYSAFQSNNYYGLRYLLYQGVYADNLQHRGTFTTDVEVSTRIINATNLQIANTWASIYTAINRANIVIREAQNVDMDEEQRNRYIAEMRFLRALAHFDLVKVFGPVPVVTEPTTTIPEIQDQGRNSVEEVYNAVISDLQFAEANLGDPISNAPYRAGSLTATALLARVYLQQGNNALAEQKADEVITSEQFQLLPNFGDIFVREGNSEIILELNFTTFDPNGLGTASDPTTGGQKFYLRQPFFDLFAQSAQQGDRRFAETTAVQRNRNRLIKYSDIAENADNVPILRLAEMYLIRAEARARQAAAGAAADEQVLEDINTIRNRAGLPDVSGLTNAEALDEILLQRRFEFVGEGLRFMDLKRYDLTCERLGFCEDEGEAFRNLWPIPLQQIEVNPNLTQNPGY
ncbi:MAG: RagB/SusD family nutrient uptake outer membrane protein [Hymenobacteraceae bacterium]|nr:RagB/SusD family nutrient uptake outer membrane protein [Hymenobacteraceae bacterium]